MRTIVKGKNVEVPERVRAYAERKLGHIARLVDDRTDAIVELSNEHHRSASDAHIVEVTLVINGRTLHSHAAGSELPGRPRHGRRQGRATGRRPQGEAARSRADRRRRSTSSGASPTAPRSPATSPAS